ncbi:hypothetical protein KP509_28G006800 [Ceratopteris richardii]|uniref:Secreted protein n=1 Tax=Ceratopteris richardii TaxID=49495 RepID=A0A8T2R9E2_CERRI|nr:hypothetical protein KP509_28G006800 [Ceratopteris richardii]
MRANLDCVIIILIAACIAHATYTSARKELGGYKRLHIASSERADILDFVATTPYKRITKESHHNRQGAQQEQINERWLYAAQVDYTLPKTHPPTKPPRN